MRVLVLGTNLRGLADVARISLSEGAEVSVYDSESPQPPEDLVSRVTVLPPEWSADYLRGVDRVVTSPWFPEVAPPISDALKDGIEVITETGFGLERRETPFVGITGTNGKTTVTELVTNMLVASGIRALGGGNIGVPVTGISDSDAELLVLELSSYQLRFLGGGVPTAAALLNIAPDHLDWHGTFEAYTEAKARIFSSMKGGSVLAYNVDDPVVVSVVDSAECTLVPCSGRDVPDGGNGVASGYIYIGGERFNTPTDDTSFLLDLVVAGTVALSVGATTEGVRAGIDGFVVGEHRREILDTGDEIRWVNDSKATNPHATVAAVGAFAPVILLAGGQNKGLDLSAICGLEGVTNLIAFGEAGSEISDVGVGDVLLTGTLKDAVKVARTIAVAGDTVLLSPGCASFDEFSSYADRGETFKRLVTDGWGEEVGGDTE